MKVFRAHGIGKLMNRGQAGPNGYAKQVRAALAEGLFACASASL